MSRKELPCRIQAFKAEIHTYVKIVVGEETMDVGKGYFLVTRIFQSRGAA